MTATETAQRIRAELKAAFPATKFSVRTVQYGYETEIAVKWSGGPTEQKVERLTRKHEHIRRDYADPGEILMGGNRMVRCTRNEA